MKRMQLIKWLLAGGTSFTGLLLPATALAQDAGTNIELEAVVVEGTGDGALRGEAIGPVKGVVAKKTLTGSKTATDIGAIPQSVSVVGREEIDDQGAQKVDEALRYTAGVFTQPF